MDKRMLDSIFMKNDARRRRVSSWDKTGGNADCNKAGRGQNDRRNCRCRLYPAHLDDR